MHYQLRTEGDSPAATASAVFLGTVIGCLPLYGLHLALCVGAAKLAGISRIKTYLAAHINNPLSAPFLLVLELAVGRSLLAGDGWGRQAVALLAGSVVVGTSAGLLLGVGALLISRRWRAAPAWERLREATARRYMDAGVFHWEFVRGKLRHDPMYREILAQPLPEQGLVLDLGCGRGIVLSLLLESDGAALRDLAGIEARPPLAEVARCATAGRAQVVVADLATHTLPSARVVLLLDVLHYLPAEEQERLIARAAAVLEPGGVMLLREAARARTLRFLFTRFGERMCCVLRGEWRRPLHYRGAEAWCELLRQQSLTVVRPPPPQATPFANVLIRAAKPA